MARRKSSPDYEDLDSLPTQQGESQGPIPGYYDSTLIDAFTQEYSPGSHQNCDIVLTEPMLRDIFNAQRDQDMTFTDPWILYKEELHRRGYHLTPNLALSQSVMYLHILEPEVLNPL